MKKYCNRVAFISIYLIFNFVSCKETDDYEKLLKDTPIKREFATNSPVAKDISLVLLDKPNPSGNFLMTADLKGQLAEPYFAYEADEKKVLMRDDGKGADAVKGDGVYSVFVNVDTAEVKNMVREQNASLERSRTLEATAGDLKNILQFLKFDNKDSVRARASHMLLLNDRGSAAIRF